MKTPTIEEKSRWLEIRFYFLCVDLIAQTKNLEAALKFLEGLSFTKLFDYAVIKETTTFMLLDSAATPQYVEACYLSARLTVPTYFLAKRYKVTVHHILYTQQKTFAAAKQDTVVVVPKLPLNTHQHIQGVFDSMTQIYKIGVQYGNRPKLNPRNARKIQKSKTKSTHLDPL